MLQSETVVAIFDGSFAGFLTLIYKHYYEKLRPTEISEVVGQQFIDAVYIEVVTDFEKSKIVEEAIIKKISKECLKNIQLSLFAEQTDKYISTYKYVIYAFKVGKFIDSQLGVDFVLDVINLVNAVKKEAHIFTGFCRFKEMKNGLFYASIEPKNNILHLLATHFSKRLNNQKWLIHDTKRNLAVAYDGHKFEIRSISVLMGQKLSVDFCEKELYYQDLWRLFFKTVAIEERITKTSKKRKVPLFDKL